jgi:hypothetical protein
MNLPTYIHFVQHKQTILSSTNSSIMKNRSYSGQSYSKTYLYTYMVTHIIKIISISTLIVYYVIL